MKDIKSVSTDENAVKSRRKVLKKVGAVSGVAAAAAWSKPTLDMVVTPAHAQMSVEMGVALGGASSSSSTPSMTMQPSKSKTLLNSALDTIVPNAHAGLDAGEFQLLCAMFLVNGDDDNTHCIQLTFDEAAADSSFTLNFTGPDIYYNNCYYDSGYAYYEGFVNFSGMASDTLDGQSFMVTVNGVEIHGTVADDFQSASGTLVLDAGLDVNVGSSRNGNEERCNTGYGAYWNVDLDGTSCSPGAGVSRATDIEVGGAYCGR